MHLNVNVPGDLPFLGFALRILMHIKYSITVKKGKGRRPAGANPRTSNTIYPSTLQDLFCDVGSYSAGGLGKLGVVVLGPTVPPLALM